MTHTIDIKTVPDLVEKRAETSGENVFHIQAETGKEYTYAEINKASSDVAATLESKNVEAEDPVSIILKNSFENVVTLFGIQKLGAIPVPINPEYTAREIQYIIDTSKSSIAITNEQCSSTVTEAIADSEVDVIYTNQTNQGPYFRSKDSTETNINPDLSGAETAILLFTSGTTGDPKGVVISHEHLLARCMDADIPHSNLLEWEPPGTTCNVCYTVLPLYNIDGIWTTISTMWSDGINVVRDGFSASSFWGDVERYEANLTSVVPSVLAILSKRGVPQEKDISSFELFVISGSHLSADLATDFEDTFGISVVEIYGLTEAAGTGYISDFSSERELGAAGYAHGFAELSVIDQDSGEHLPSNEKGEIVIRGKAVFEEYYNNPEKTSEAFTDNWFHTGDIGYKDRADRYYIIGRIKDTIIRGGQNIYPSEIKKVLLTHKSVEDATVIGVEDEIYGEIVQAYVTTDSSNGDKLSGKLTEYCKGQLADFKVPAEILIIDELPRGETGKILKEEL